MQAIVAGRARPPAYELARKRLDAPDPDKPERTVFERDGQTDALGALKQLFLDPTLPGASARERLKFVLWFNKNEFMLYFRNKVGDTGFAPDMQDQHLWQLGDGLSNQVGHFLTAVGMGYQRPGVRQLFMFPAVGHEKSGDPGNGAGLLHKVHVALGQAMSATPRDIYTFMGCVKAARHGDRSTVNAGVAQILSDLPENHEPWPTSSPRLGNSRQDLRLTAYGFALGQLIREGRLRNGADVAQWLTVHIGA